MIRAIVEEILHFTCDQCKNVWSIPTMESYRPKELHCPYCGHKDEIGFIDFKKGTPLCS